MDIHPAAEDRLARLAQDQRAAATAPSGPSLCIAPAGSGKTTTLVARAAWLVATGVDPAGIRAITFNKRAAVELAERLDAALEPLGIALPLAPAVAQVTVLDAPTMVGRPGVADWPEPGGVGVYGHPVPGVGFKLAFDAGPRTVRAYCTHPVSAMANTSTIAAKDSRIDTGSRPRNTALTRMAISSVGIESTVSPSRISRLSMRPLLTNSPW